MTDIDIVFLIILAIFILAGGFLLGFTTGMSQILRKLDELIGVITKYFNGEILVTEKAWQDIVDDIRYCEDICQAHENSGYIIRGRYRLYHDLLERFDRGERSRELYWAMLKADLLKTPEERNIK